MRKMLLAALAIPLMVLGLTANAHAEFRGRAITDYVYGANHSNWQFGDSSDGSYYHVTGTQSWCREQGDSYPFIQEIIDGGRVRWEIADRCYSVVRICVWNHVGRGCTSFRIGEEWVFND